MWSFLLLFALLVSLGLCDLQEGAAHALSTYAKLTGSTISATGLTLATSAYNGADIQSSATGAMSWIDPPSSTCDPIQKVAVSITAAQIAALYTTPVIILAAPPSTNHWQILGAEISYTWATASFTGGLGFVGLQFGVAPNLAGTLAIGSCSSATSNLFGQTVSSVTQFGPGTAVTATTAILGQPVTLSNTVAAYIQGSAAGTALVTLWVTLV